SVDARGGGEPARPIPLSDGARGKVIVGDTTVLFQLLRPPPPQPRPQLPIAVRRRVTAGVDWAFSGVLAFTFLLHVAIVIYLRQVDWPRRPAIEEIPDRFIRQTMHLQRPTPVPPPTAVAANTPTPTPPAHAPRSPFAPPRPTPGKPREDPADAVKRMGLI